VTVIFILPEIVCTVDSAENKFLGVQINVIISSAYITIVITRQ